MAFVQLNLSSTPSMFIFDRTSASIRALPNRQSSIVSPIQELLNDFSLTAPRPPESSAWGRLGSCRRLLHFPE